MARAGDRDVDTRESHPGQGQEPPAGDVRGTRAGARLLITRISDEDYRCVWRPCPALEEDEGDATAR